jgi:hypothetical protein
MKFLMTYASSAKAPPTPEHIAAIARFGQEMTEAGVLLMTGGLVRPGKGTQVRLEGGKFTVLDGPFAETKEVIDGFALVQTRSKQEAIDVAQRFMRVAGDGEAEILQLSDGGDLER